jgi:hypothetical protein
MLAAVCLDDQSGFLANKVGDEWPNGLLATKLCLAKLSGTQN